MYTFSTIDELKKHLNKVRVSGKRIGFVPTMGALHAGHTSLIHEAKKETDFVVASIFVNPTQFNNADDLKNYPRMLDKDIELLQEHFCDAVFIPDVETIYPENYSSIKLDLSPLDTVMEGKYRPGHFDGVVNVVYRLFDIIEPQKAFFGNKDFQQVAIIKAMTKKVNLPIQIIGCPTLREKNGLALSSRNLRLSEDQRTEALALYKTLILGEKIASYLSPKETLKEMIQHFTQSSLELEYLEIVDPTTLLPLTDFWVPGATACIVAYCGEVRLIDNMTLLPIKEVVTTV